MMLRRFPNMKFATKRLLLRPIRLTDLPDIYALRAFPNVAVYAGFPLPKSIADTRKYIRQALAEWKEPGLKRMTFSIASKRDEIWIGGINLRWPHVGVGEIGYSIHPRFWGNGYATEAARRIVDFAFEEFKAHRVQATCWVKNTKSARVLRKIGFRKEGRL